MALHHNIINAQMTIWLQAGDDCFTIKQLKILGLGRQN